jgi:hypothetical protein
VKAPINTVQVSSELKRKVEYYLEALETKEFNRISPFFTGVLDSYYGQDKVTFNHVWRLMKQDWRKIGREKFAVTWNTWKYRLDEASERHIVSFTLQRTYELEDKAGEEKKEDKNMEFTFDRNYKIFRVDKPSID